MRIAIVGIGGVSVNFYNWPERAIGRAMVQHGHAVTAYTYRDPNSADMAADEVIDGIEVWRVPAKQWRNREFEAQLARQPRPDVAHIYHPRNLLAYTAARHYRRVGVPMVYTWSGPFHDEFLIDDREAPWEQTPHYERIIFDPRTALIRALTSGNPKRTMRNFAMHWPLRQATRFAPVSHHEAEVLQRFGLPAARTCVVPHWIDDAPYRGELQAVAATAGLPRPWLLYIGQLTRRKCYDLVAAAMPTIVAAHPTASFLFVTHNPEQRAHLTALAEQRGVAGNLHFLGRLSEEQKASLMRQSDVYLYPSRYEGFGLPLLEAMAADLPLISTDIAAVNETIRDGYNGLLTLYNDAPALAAAAMRLLADSDLRQRLIQGGRETLNTSHKQATLVGQLEQQYLLAQQPQ